MGTFSLWHLVVILALVTLLFGRGRFSRIMQDLADGIVSFRRGISERDPPHDRLN